MRIYIIGTSILIIAIIANIIVDKLGLSTWYSFGNQFAKKGLLAVNEVGILSCLWLFILYPLTLGLGYLIGEKIYKLLT
tara:strand:+ start:287 stop:523 length:237 start_codon:yes stop_codon:yes gene_type:complete